MNSRGQRASISTPSFPAATFDRQGSRDLAEQALAGTLWQGSRALRNADSVGNVPAALSSTLTNSTSPLASPDRVFVRPLALFPRTIETLQLNTTQIDTLFQLYTSTAAS